MAEGTQDLFLRLGLNYDELESGFVEAESTIRQNMTRLSNENTIIKLRAEAELAGLDEIADAAEIFAIKQRTLNHQIAVQRDRVNVAQAALQDMANRYGATSQQAQRATMSFERQRITLARLEQQLRELNETQNESQNNGGGGFSENIQNILGDFPAVGGKILAVVAAFKAVEESISAVSNKTVELIEKFRELQKQSYDLNMSFAESKKFLRQMRLGGGDYGDFEGYIRGITDAFVKGEYDDPEAVALNKYGAKITDATGRLKNFKDLTEEVYQAWKKADAAGEGIEFLQLTGGEAGIRDAIQFFKRYEEAKEDASKIFDSGIDPDELHKAERALNLLTEQSGEFKDALANMITPAATFAMEKLFEIFHSGTEIVAESTKKIQRWSLIFGEIFSNRQKIFSGEINFDEVFERANEKLKIYNALQEETKKKNDEIKNSSADPLNQYGIKRINQFKEELEDLRIEIDFDGDDYKKSLEQAKIWLERELKNKWFLGKDEENAIRDLYSAKVEQIEQQHAAELEKIQEESAKRTQEMLKNAADIEFEHTHSAFEKQLRDIEQWKDAQLEKATTAEEVAATIKNAAMKEADAFEKEMDRIKGKIESAQDRLARLTLSQYENDVRNAQKQYLEDVKELPKGLADALYRAEIRQIKKRAGEDKSGDYMKRPDGGGSQFLNFTKNQKSWLDVDSKILAQQQIFKNKLYELGNQAVQTADKFKNAGSKINTIQLGWEKFNEWQKSEEKIKFPDEQTGGAIYGDDPFFSHNYEQNGIKIIYGDDESGTTENFSDDFDSEEINFENAIQQMTNSQTQRTAEIVTNIQNLTQNVTQLLNNLSQTAGQIAQTLSTAEKNRKPPPNINIQLTPTINLGGAYVFDNAMKRQLTDDITREVANAVKSAVEGAATQMNFCYGN